MFGYHLIKHDSKIEGDGTKLKIKSGYNNISKDYFISITDRKTLLTLRVNMTEDWYKGFYNMSSFTHKQTLNSNRLSDKKS